MDGGEGERRGRKVKGGRGEEVEGDLAHYFNDLRAISVLARYIIFCPHVGAPFFGGPCSAEHA